MRLVVLMSTVLLTLCFASVYAADMSMMAEDQPYCGVRYRRLCQGKGRHVACMFPNPGPGESCQNYTQIKFTKELRHFITNYINRIPKCCLCTDRRRERLAAGIERVRGGSRIPKPDIMMWVEWDRELAFLAQRLADQCTFVHDNCRATVRYPYSGQTVGEVRWRAARAAAGAGAARAARRVLDAWWGERRRVLPHFLTRPFKLATRGAAWGHFSQLAVWRLRAVGCGAVRHGNARSRLLLVCDYSHTNMLGQATITPGPLAACPQHTARRPRSAFPLLCAPVRDSRPADGENYEDNASEYIFHYEYDDGTATEEDDEKDQDEETDVASAAEELNQQADGVRLDEAEDRSSKTTTETSSLPVGTGAIVKLEEELIHSQLPFKRPKETKTPYLRPTTSWTSARRYEDMAELHPPMRKGLSKVADHKSNRLDRPRSRQRVNDQPQHPGLDRLEDRASVRRRWKYTSRRLHRPGADALLMSTSAREMVAPPAKYMSEKVGFALDKSDEDQLFKDTGFKMNWRHGKG